MHVGVSRSGYYKWLKRDGEPNRYQANQDDLDRLTIAYHSQFPSLGYRSMKGLIRDETGWLVCDTCVHKSMKRQSIKAKPRRPVYHYYSEGREHKVFPNHLDRNYNADKPYEKIVTDIACMKNKGQTKYFSLFIDLFNNSIIAAKLASKQDNHIVVDPLKRILEEKSIRTPQLLHSDQGCQYSSLGYVSLLKKYNVMQSMSRAGTPRDNAVAESLIGRFKDVLFWDFNFYTSEDPAKTFNDAIRFFNCKRPSYALNYKTPARYTNEQGYEFLCLQTID